MVVSLQLSAPSQTFPLFSHGCPLPSFLQLALAVASTVVTSTVTSTSDIPAAVSQAPHT